MAEIVDYVAEPEKKRIPFGLTEDDVARMEAYAVESFGHLTPDDVERLIVGFLVSQPPHFDSPRDPELLLESGIRKEHFEDKLCGMLFEDLLAHYKVSRKIATFEDIGQKCLILGQTQDEAEMYKYAMAKYHSARVNRPGIALDLIIRRFKIHYRCRTADRIIKRFGQERNDASVGPEKALDRFRSDANALLVDTGGGVLREADFVEDFAADVGWMLDMKNCPEKYQGLSCGIMAIDKRTNGFRPGHLTVFVGKHGGYKSTVMMNVAYGCWERGANVLYVSLEMESKLVKGKLWCRGTQHVKWTKVYSGTLSTAADWKERDDLRARLPGTKDPAELRRINDRISRLDSALTGTERGQEDLTVMTALHKEMEGRKNKFKVVNAGQSQKIKVSQLERFIEDKMQTFKPDVVVVDYLALVDSEKSYSDRRDLEVGEVCKYLRAMGERLNFSVITAAQFKRAAVERIRKFGFNNPEKAALGTDDIAESNQIGADADTVFMLWLEDGKTRLRVFNPKCRHGIPGPEGGECVQVVQDICYIGDNAESVDSLMRHATPQEINRMANEIVRNETPADPVPAEEEEEDGVRQERGLDIGGDEWA